MKITPICNGDFAVRIGNSKERGMKVLDILYKMGYAWSSARGDGGIQRVLNEAVDSYGEATGLFIYRNERKIYYGGDASWRQQHTPRLLFTYDDFIKEVECPE